FPPEYGILYAYSTGKMLPAMRTLAGAPRADHAIRLLAIGALWSHEPPEAVRPLVESLLSKDTDRGSAEFRGKVLDALGELDDPAVGAIVLKAFPRLTAPLKLRAVELLSERPAWTKALLTAVADRRIAASALNVTQIRKLQHSKDAEIVQRVKAIWG